MHQWMQVITQHILMSNVGNITYSLSVALRRYFSPLQHMLCHIMTNTFSDAPWTA